MNKQQLVLLFLAPAKYQLFAIAKPLSLLSKSILHAHDIHQCREIFRSTDLKLDSNVTENEITLETECDMAGALHGLRSPSDHLPS